MEKISVIKKIKYVPGWNGKEEVLYFHELIMDNGDEGKLQANNEERPAWLKEEITIRYDITPGKWRYGKQENNIRVLAVTNSSMPPSPQEHAAETIINEKIPSATEVRKNKFDKNPEQSNPKKGGWGSRLDDQIPFWMARQKCISMTTCLDRATEAVVSGKIKKEDRHKYALEDFNVILEHSRLNELTEPVATFNPPATVEKKSDTKVLPKEKGKGKGQAALFREENMTPSPIPDFVREAINRCTKPSDIKNLKTQLREEEARDENIIYAISIKEAEIKANKK